MLLLIAVQGHQFHPFNNFSQFLQLKALNPDVKVNLSESPFDNEKYPSHVSLLVCSSKYGYFVAGTPKGTCNSDH